MRRLHLLLITVLFLLGGCAGEADHNVLFIGNSYTHTNDMPAMVRKIADANNVTINTTMIAPGGAFLDEHVRNPDVVNALRSGDYDTVVFQEQSVAPSFAEFANGRTKPAASELTAIAAETGTRVIWFQTWGHLNGFPGVGHDGYDTMQSAIIGTYDEISRANGGSVARVGERWRRMLNSGQNIGLYSLDGTHPSPAGSYVAAIEITDTIVMAPIEVAPAVDGVDETVASAILST